MSSSVSPLMVDDDEPEMLTASADSRLAAISNEVRVRVEASRNRLMTVLPAQRRHLLDRPLVDLEEALAEVEDWSRSSAGRERLDPEEVAVARSVRHARRSRSTTRSGSPRSDSITRTDSAAVVCTVRPTIVGLDRQLAPARDRPAPPA